LFSVTANPGAQLFKGMAIGSLKPPALPEVADFSARFGLSKLLRFDRNDVVGELVGFEITSPRRVRNLWCRTTLECSPARLKRPSLHTTWHGREIFSAHRSSKKEIFVPARRDS